MRSAFGLPIACGSSAGSNRSLHSPAMLAEHFPATIIRPPQGWVALGLRELWGYRELFSLFVWRDLKIRYKQTY